MSSFLDTALVLLATALALGYLIWRKVSASRRGARAWESGHSEVCTSCPVIKIHEARMQKASTQDE